MDKAGVPIVPGATAPVEDVAAAKKQAKEIGYPVACKAAGGGGGKGFRVASERGRARGRLRGRRPRGREVLQRSDRLPRALPRGPAPRRGPGARRLARERHPPRRARLLDPAPPPEADRGVARRRTSTTRCASGSARSPPTPPRRSDYRSAGTVEGLQVGDDYFFLEMNTRVQVEHCVTEMVTGIDIVREQVLIAAGEGSRSPRTRSSSAATRSSAGSTRRPRTRTSRRPPGGSTTYREPAGPGVRVDSGVEAGSEVTPLYDPMIAKLIVWDRRPRAGDGPDAAGARRVRDRRPDDADPVPSGDPRDRAVGERRRPAATSSGTRSG